MRVKAFVAGLLAEAIREVVPSDTDLTEAELFRPNDRAQVMRELERVANHYLAEALRFESM